MSQLVSLGVDYLGIHKGEIVEVITRLQIFKVYKIVSSALNTGKQAHNIDKKLQIDLWQRNNLNKVSF